RALVGVRVLRFVHTAALAVAELQVILEPRRRPAGDADRDVRLGHNVVVVVGDLPLGARLQGDRRPGRGGGARIQLDRQADLFTRVVGGFRGRSGGGRGRGGTGPRRPGRPRRRRGRGRTRARPGALRVAGVVGVAGVAGVVRVCRAGRQRATGADP